MTRRGYTLIVMRIREEDEEMSYSSSHSSTASAQNFLRRRSTIVAGNQLRISTKEIEEIEEIRDDSIYSLGD